VRFIEERPSDCPAAVRANQGSELRLTTVSGWQFARLKENWLGKIEPDDRWIFCLKAARIRLELGATPALKADRRAPHLKLAAAASPTSREQRRDPRRGEVAQALQPIIDIN
jgi:hypothetical protein